MKHLFFLLFIINIISFSQSQIKSVVDPCNGVTTVTYEGKTYNTVAIGDQCWLKENLDVGTMILGAQEATDNGVIEKYCYDDDPNNCITYGGLYQWNEAMHYTITPGTQGICPTGWHIPTLAEFQALSDAVRGNSNALKSVGQGHGGGTGTNSSGFSALLAGFRYINGYFNFLTDATWFWGSSESSATRAYYMALNPDDSTIYLLNYTKDYGLSVRCLKDALTTGMHEPKIPFDYALYQNYPNPFNPSTTISFSIAEEVKVNLAVYDLLGREIEILVDDNLNSGKYKVEFNAKDRSSGIYFYRITAGDYTNSKKLQILK